MLLESQYNQEQIQEARELPTVAVLDQAAVPLRPSAPRKTIFVSITGILLIVFSVIGVYIYDGLQRGIYSAQPVRVAEHPQPSVEDHK